VCLYVCVWGVDIVAEGSGRDFFRLFRMRCVTRGQLQTREGCCCSNSMWRGVPFLGYLSKIAGFGGCFGVWRWVCSSDNGNRYILLCVW
jgi:hypothetical protein